MQAVLALFAGFRGLPWKLIGLVSLAFAVLSLFAHDRMVVAQNAKLKAQLARIIEESKRKQVEVREVIKEGKTKIVTVRQEAEKIEKAPLPGNCQTPKAVLEADV